MVFVLFAAPEQTPRSGLAARCSRPAARGPVNAGGYRTATLKAWPPTLTIYMPVAAGTVRRPAVTQPSAIMVRPAGVVTLTDRLSAPHISMAASIPRTLTPPAVGAEMPLSDNLTSFDGIDSPRS